MILADSDILKNIKKGKIKIQPFKKENLQPASLDLELAEKVRVFDNWQVGIIDIKKKTDPSRLVKIPPRGFVLHPGEFILGATKEKITLSNDIAAKLEGRSSLGRLGLIIHATAGYVDPGFSGWLTFEITNVARLPIKIYTHMRVAQICFYQMSSPVAHPYGDPHLKSKYQGQKDATASRAWQDFKKSSLEKNRKET